MTPKKCEEIGDKKFHKRKRSNESRTNSSDTENLIGDHAPIKPKDRVYSDAESSDYSLVNAADKKWQSKRVQVDTFRFRDSIRPCAKSPKKAPNKPKASQLKKTPSKKLVEEAVPEPQPVTRPQKPWLRYSNVAQNALSLLNNEVSSALCQVLGSIDDIQMRVRVTMDEIQQCDKTYERLRHQKGSPIPPSATSENLPRAFEVDLLQSENQALEIPVALDEDSNSDEEVTIVETKPAEPRPKCSESETKRSLPESEKRVVAKKGKKKSKVIQILAEELYVPEKINKIIESNLTAENSAGMRFMYQETRKKFRKKKKCSNTESAIGTVDGSQCNIIIDTMASSPDASSSYAPSKSGLNCFDILDEITLSDVRPLKSEYPRRDREGRKVETTYLHRLVHGSMQDQFLELLRLEEPSLACSQKRCESCSSEKTKGPKRSDNDEVATKLRQYLFDPHIRYPTTITVMPVVVTTYTNPNFVPQKTPGGDYAAPSATKRTPKPAKPNDKPAKKASRATPRRDESWGDCKTTSIAKSPKPNRKWENNIQSLIELVEHKIVEILSDPKSTHLDAFKSVEAKIIELLHGQKSLDAIEERKPRRPKFHSKTTSNLEKSSAKTKNPLESSTYPSLAVDNVRSLPLQIMRLNLKAPTSKRVDESTATTKSITDTKSEQTSCAFPEIQVINFLDTLANISTDALAELAKSTRTTVFYKSLVQISYPLSTSTLFHTVRITAPGLILPPSRIQRSNSSLPVRTQKKQPQRKTSAKTVTFKTKEQENRNPTTNDGDGAEWEVEDGFDYNRLLSYVYGALYTIEFLALTMNYSCE